MKLFTDTDFSPYKHTNIILDVDGTVCSDGSMDVDEKTRLKIQEIQKENTVYLCSNKDVPSRLESLAVKLGVRYISSDHKKPSKQVLSGITGTTVVVGDKFLTDGLLALKTGSRFVKVKRIPTQNTGIQVIDFIDDVVSAIVYVIQSMRPRQQVKNILILAPLFFGREFGNEDKLVYTIGACIVFSILAGAVYMFNDLLDREQDRLHSSKRYRPIAAGYISQKVLWPALGLLSALIVIGVYLIPALLPWVIGYLVLNILYSTWAKHLPILDILFVSVFYLIRIYTGGAVADVEVSPWLSLTTLFLALFIVIGRRYGEIHGSAVRDVAKVYTPAYLSGLLHITASMVLVSYGLYTILGVAEPLFVLSNLLVIYGIFVYLGIINNKNAEAPEQILFKHKGIQATVILWILLVTYISYIK